MLLLILGAYLPNRHLFAIKNHHIHHANFQASPFSLHLFARNSHDISFVSASCFSSSPCHKITDNFKITDWRDSVMSKQFRPQANYCLLVCRVQCVAKALVYGNQVEIGGWPYALAMG